MLEVISLGAGVQSTVMALMAAEGEIGPRPDCAIFADTQAEPKGVYKHLDWLERQLSDASRVKHPFPIYRVTNGNLRDDLLDPNKNAGAPFFTESTSGGMLGRQCTNNYKIVPLRRKLRELSGLVKGQRFPKSKPPINLWIGISTDESVRIKPSRDWWINNTWPLIEKEMSRQKCIEWFNERFPDRVLSKSACTFCPYHDNATWRDLKVNDAESWADAVAFDKEIRDGIRGTKNKLYLHRSLKPLDEVDVRNLEDMGQLNMFGNECEGMCGV
jgi:hypothetical protein